jgi:hypothetical protein
VVSATFQPLLLLARSRALLLNLSLFERSLIFCLVFFEFRKIEFGSVLGAAARHQACKYHDSRAACRTMFSGLIFALPSFRNSMVVSLWFLFGAAPIFAASCSIF